MSLNCNELNVVLGELEMEESFIQEIIQPSYDMLWFRLIKHGTLQNIVICTKASVCRINSTTSRAPKNVKPLRFYEFLRSHVQGMRINSARQMGLDRIIKLDVSTWQERFYIYIRLWSGAANVIVTDEKGTILDCMYRRPKKNEVTGAAFIIEEKIPSSQEREEALKKFPIRDFGEIKDAWEDAHPSGSFDALSFNQKVDIFYTEYALTLSRESLLEQAEKWYNTNRSKMTSALEHLLQKQKEFEGADRLKHTGDLILAYAQDAKGSFLDCEDYESGQKVHIVLDKTKSAHENAALYYERYKKAISGMEDLAHDIELSRRNIQALDEEYNSIIKEKNVMKIEQLLRKDSTPKQKLQEKKHAGLHYEIDGWAIMVGRTSGENDDLLRHSVSGSDMWLHTRDYAGGYVFIKARKNKSVPLDILLYAGTLAVYHSKARKNGEADLYYTQVKHLRRAKNGPKGLVLPTQEKNLFVKLDPARLRRLDEAEK